MSYGKLTLYTGPMFADKTNRLIKDVLYQTYFDDASGVGVYKLDFDDRLGRGKIVSHDGRAVTATEIAGPREIRVDGASHVFLDEIHFFIKPYFDGDIVETIRGLRRRGVDVTCAGLDMDFLGRAFEVTAALMAESTCLVRLTSECAICPAPATHTARTLPAPTQGRRIELGSGESYAPMCAHHWLEHHRASAGDEGFR